MGIYMIKLISGLFAVALLFSLLGCAGSNSTASKGVDFKGGKISST